MKKNYSAFAVIISSVTLFATPASAYENKTNSEDGYVQSTEEMPVERSANAMEIYLKGGPGFSKLSYDRSSATGQSEESRSGIFVGVETAIPFNQTFAIQTGVNYAQKGLSLIFNGPSFNGTSSIALNYIQIPLLGKVTFGSDDSFQFSALAGPYGAFAVARNESISFSGSGLPSTSIEEDLSNDVSAFDYGLRMGAEFSIPVASGFSMVLGAQYDLGLNNLSSSASDPVVYNRSLIATAGIGFIL